MQTKSRFIFNNKKQEAEKKITVIIYGSNATPRMRSFGPKSLFKDMNGKYLIQHQINAIKSAIPNCEIILITGYESDKVAKRRPKAIRIVENQNYETTNEVEDIRLGLNNAMNSNILLIPSDAFLTSSVLNNIHSDTCIMTSEEKPKYEIGATVVNNKVTILSLEIKKVKWCSILYFEEPYTDILYNFVSNKENSKLFLFEAINFILNKYEINNFALKCPDSLICVDSSKELRKIGSKEYLFTGGYY